MKNDRRILKNISWIVGARIGQSVLAIIVSMFTARYLGPSNYGIINYASSLVLFVTPIMKLGLPSILVQEFVTQPEEEGRILGTSMVLGVISSFFCILGILVFTSIANCGERTTIIVCVLYSLILVFQALEMTLQWFQTHYLSKFSSIAILIGSVSTSIYRIILLITGCSVYWFAVAAAFDYFIISTLLLIFYFRNGGQKLSFSFALSFELLSKSKFYIVSGLLIVVFSQIDRVMIKNMLGDRDTGLYAAAINTANLAQFVYEAIIFSFRPAILENKQTDNLAFEKKLTQLYSIVIYLSLLQSLVLTIFAPLIIQILYGNDYMQSVQTLRIICWFAAFTYYGGALEVWILAESKQKWLLVLNVVGAITNITLNWFLIPRIGIDGAAVATLVTYFLSNIAAPLFISSFNNNNKLLLRSLNPKSILNN